MNNACLALGPRHLLAGCILLAVALFVTACGAVTSGFREFAEFRHYEAREDFVRPPVIFIPGIKGSRLVVVDEQGREIEELWGSSSNVAIRKGFDRLFIDLGSKARSKAGAPGTPGESFPSAEAYAPVGSSELHPLYVRAEFLPVYRLGFRDSLTFAEYDVYKTLVEFLTNPAEGGYSENNDLFIFSYDWRLDNRVAAARLKLELSSYRERYLAHQFLKFCERRPPCDPESRERKKQFAAYWEKLSSLPANAALFDSGQIKFIFVAHSMGGLVARYFVWGMERQNDVSRVILLGTPNFGAIDTLKGLRDGEYPEALWTWIMKHLGRVFSVLPWMEPYEEEDTKPILFSFGSVFQLLPRHTGRSVLAPLSLDNLGLNWTEPLRSFEERGAQAYFNEYKRLGLLPTWNSMKRYAPDIDQNTAEGALRGHLYANLRSSLCFYKVIDFGLSSEEKRQGVRAECDEDRRIKLAIELVQKMTPDLQRINEDAKEDSQRNRVDRPPLISFAGHCHPTFYSARFDHRQNRLIFDRARTEAQSEREGGRGYEYGDGRVPIWSAGWERPLRGEVDGYSFFLCEDHMGLVRNPAFRYNLLRELFVLQRW